MSPLYPVVPALFVGVAILIVVSVLRSNPVGSMIGAGLLLTGVPAYLYWSKKN